MERGVISRGGRKLCWHRDDFDEVHGVWRYQECSRCGRRKISRVYSNLMGPLDWTWLETGEWQPPPKLPPGGSQFPRPEMEQKG